MSDNRLSIMTLKLIAAKADKLAYDLEAGRLWEGQLSQGLSEIQSQLNDLLQNTRTDR